jgi:hypothetical protein
MGSKRKNTKKVWGEHQRIYIRRSIRRKLQKQWLRLEGGLAKRRALFPEGRGLGVGGKEKVKKKKQKAWGEHQRIYNRRSIKNGGLTVIDKRGGSWGK